MVTIPDVISLIPGRVRITTFREKLVVVKNTSAFEAEMLEYASKWLNECISGLDMYGEEWKIQTPTIIEWDGKKNQLFLEFCQGVNVESILRSTTNKRFFVVSLINQFLTWVKDNGFLWGGMAPRNMIISTEKKTLYIFDFETPLTINSECTIDTFMVFLRDKVYEELAAFLLREELLIQPQDVYDSCDSSKFIAIEDIHSRRKKALINLIHGNISIITDFQLSRIEKMMVNAVEPIQTFGDGLYFPLVFLEKIKDERGYNEYAETVWELNHQPRDRWIDTLRAKTWNI